MHQSSYVTDAGRLLQTPPVGKFQKPTSLSSQPRRGFFPRREAQRNFGTFTYERMGHKISAPHQLEIMQAQPFDRVQLKDCPRAEQADSIHRHMTLHWTCRMCPESQRSQTMSVQLTKRRSCPPEPKKFRRRLLRSIPLDLVSGHRLTLHPLKGKHNPRLANQTPILRRWTTLSYPLYPNPRPRSTRPSHVL